MSKNTTLTIMLVSYFISNKIIMATLVVWYYPNMWLLTIKLTLACYYVGKSNALAPCKPSLIWYISQRCHRSLYLRQHLSRKVLWQFGVNTLKPEQIFRHFEDISDFCERKCVYSITISIKCVQFSICHHWFRRQATIWINVDKLKLGQIPPQDQDDDIADNKTRRFSVEKKTHSFWDDGHRILFGEIWIKI